MRTPIAIVGMGISGQATHRLLLARGYSPNDLMFFDDKKSEADYQNHKDLLLKGKPQTLVVSPGYPLREDWISKACALGITVTSELAIAFLSLKKEKIIGITGSLGKSTVVSLLGEGAKTAQESAFIGGNLGIPLADYIRNTYFSTPSKKPVDWLILELSSYQLENCGSLFSNYSGFTYFTPNHLERYPNLQTYYATKWELAKRTCDLIICNSQSEDLNNFVTSLPQKEKKQLCKLTFTNDNSAIFTPEELSQAKLIGKHNIDNLLLAASIAEACSWKTTYKIGMLSFVGLPHRIENLGTIAGIRFINDSKATTLQSVETAISASLETIPSSKKLILLLGGKDKQLPWEMMKKFRNNPQILFIFFGADGSLIQKKSGLSGEIFLTLNKALEHLQSLANPGDTVLLSPGGTSLDEFKNFEDRGNFFKNKINTLF